MSGSPSRRGWFVAAPPPAAIQIAASRVSVVVLNPHGRSATVSGYAVAPMAPGVVTPTLNAVNVHDRAALTAALTAALDRVSPRPKRAALVLPDIAAKVSLLRFDKVPAKMQDLEQLIRWQIRKAAPFRIEDAQVAWTEGGEVAGGGREYLVVLARRDIVESYERACDDAGVYTGLVDITSPNLVNAALATQPAASNGDWLLVHTAAGYSTLIVVRTGRVIFFRNRPSDTTAQDISDLVHQTAMYYEDRLGGASFGRVLVSGGSADPQQAAAMRKQIEERLGTRVELLDVSGGVTLRDRIAAGAEVLDLLAPAVGVLLRDRAPAAQASRPSREKVA